MEEGDGGVNVWEGSDGVQEVGSVNGVRGCCCC